MANGEPGKAVTPNTEAASACYDDRAMHRRQFIRRSGIEDGRLRHSALTPADLV
jgi:hypothetical protein